MYFGKELFKYSVYIIYIDILLDGEKLRGCAYNMFIVAISLPDKQTGSETDVLWSEIIIINLSK